MNNQLGSKEIRRKSRTRRWDRIRPRKDSKYKTGFQRNSYFSIVFIDNSEMVEVPLNVIFIISMTILGIN